MTPLDSPDGRCYPSYVVTDTTYHVSTYRRWQQGDPPPLDDLHALRRLHPAARRPDLDRQPRQATGALWLVRAGGAVRGLAHRPEGLAPDRQGGGQELLFPHRARRATAGRGHPAHLRAARRAVGRPV